MDRNYSDNINLEYFDSALEMDKKLLIYIENADNIIKVIKSSTRETVRSNLQEKLGCSLEEANNILRINFGMMTAEDVEEIKSEIVRQEAIIKQRMVNQGVVQRNNVFYAD